jgi:membrane fusion protein, heavy metal efflux system
MKIITTTLLFSIFTLLFLPGCRGKIKTVGENAFVIEAEPIVKDGGRIIEFPEKSEKLKLFKTQKIKDLTFNLSISAPATVIGRAEKSATSYNNTIILFESSELTSVYSSFLQNITLEKTAKMNFDRVNDLYKNGAATGKELNDASAELINIQTVLAENEAKLRESGLNPENLNNSPRGTVWLICDLPESELNLVKRGQRYNLEFPSFPEETISANIDVIAEVMNTQTRKVRIRLSLLDTKDRFRPGMYAKVKFETPHSGLMIPIKAVFSANARYYVFIKTSENSYERREVTVSTETGDFIELSSGVTKGEDIVTTNVYLLKGIDMGI